MLFFGVAFTFEIKSLHVRLYIKVRLDKYNKHYILLDLLFKLRKYYLVLNFEYTLTTCYIGLAISYYIIKINSCSWILSLVGVNWVVKDYQCSYIDNLIQDRPYVMTVFCFIKMYSLGMYTYNIIYTAHYIVVIQQ